MINTICTKQLKMKVSVLQSAKGTGLPIVQNNCKILLTEISKTIFLLSGKILCQSISFFLLTVISASAPGVRGRRKIAQGKASMHMADLSRVIFHCSKFRFVRDTQQVVTTSSPPDFLSACELALERLLFSAGASL